MNDLLAKLAAPFPPDRISWRVGSTNGDKTKGMALAYIDARDVQDRLDAVLGGVNWQNRFVALGVKTCCEIGIRHDDGHWVWKSDGAGDSDVEADKGAFSDAFKRAAVKWGVGRYLYDIDSPWVQIVQKGRSYVIAENELIRLQKLLPGSKAAVAKAEDNLARVAENMASGKSVDKEKSPPGRHGVATDVREHCREMNACADGDQLLAYINADKFKAFAFKVCCQFPNDWLGPEDNSGLSGTIAQMGETLKCADDCHSWISRMERARDERAKQPKHAAE